MKDWFGVRGTGCGVRQPARQRRNNMLFGLFFLLFPPLVVNAQEARELTAGEFNTELRQALFENNEGQVSSFISGHRLFVKPFVDALIKESISKELKGKLNESKQLSTIAGKTAEVFNKIFNEKSLLIAVNYLSTWTKDQKKSKLVADSLNALGISLRGKEPQKAAEIYQKAIELYRNIGDERGQAEILGGFGLIYSSTDGEKSMHYYQEALKAREKVDDKLLIGNTLNSLGSINYSFLKDYQEAVKYFERAELVRKEIGDLPNVARTLTNKAQTYEKMGNAEEALKSYKESYEISQELGDQTRMAESLIKSGSMFVDLGKYPEAVEDLERALKISRELNNSRGISDALNNIGFVNLKMGDYNTALEKFNQAIKIYQEQNDLWGLAGVYNNLAIMLQSSGRTEKALEYYNNALSIYEQEKDQSNILVSLINIGTIYFDLKNYSKAIEYYQKGLELSRELHASDQEAACLLNIANAQNLMGKSEAALMNYRTGFGIAKSLNNPDLLWRFIAGLAENYETRGEWDKVVELNDTTLKILEGLRKTMPGDDYKTTFMAKERWVYEDIIDLLQTLNEKDKSKGYDLLAFRYNEQSKSRTLLELLGKNEMAESKPVSLEEVQALCPDRNTVILEYAVGDSSSSLWVITASAHQLFRLPARKALQEKIETIRFAMLDPKQSIPEFFTQAAFSLYETLIKPAEQFLSKRSKIIIIPDGILNYLPFEVLLTENRKIDERKSYSDMPFLVKRYPISYAQSASVLKTLISQSSGPKKPEPESRKLLAFGDPLYEDTLLNPINKYPRLEFSGKEIENIAAYFTGGSSEIYLRNKATEENLKQNNELDKFNYIHFATHGLINEDKPDLSSIVLTSAKNSGEDGFLQAAEIFNLKLNADLVVLSACQTGLGKLVRGEGMVGLTRAFMYAGTPSVVVSLWSVSDMSTDALMGEFYRNLIKNKLSKTDALRKAQLTLINNEKYAHPFYWAPFILIGDWR